MTIAIAAILTSLAVADCGSTGPGPEGPSLADAFGLRIGASAPIRSTSLEVEFVDVNSDSRCPKGEQCVWEGDATVRIQLSEGPEAGHFVELHTAHDHEQTAGHNGYGVRLLRLDPQPVSGHPIEASDYCAVLEVTLGTDPSGELQ